jgi:6,7-dimethyl-8-ribityllumazine synthase
MARIAVVVGKFHEGQAKRMVAEVKRFCAKHAHSIASIVWVPGSMEKPLALKRLLDRPDVDGAVALGIIERGETAHGTVMANAVISNIIRLQIDFDKPIGIGILGPEIFPSQIEPRVASYARHAVEAVHHMLEEPKIKRRNKR